MNKIIFFIVLIFYGLGTFAQPTPTTIAGSFQLLKNQSPEKLAFFSGAILKSNLETYRLKNKRVVLEFKNGFQCELLSAKELFLKGEKIDMNAYQENFDNTFTLPVFTVSDNGWLLAEHISTGKSY